MGLKVSKIVSFEGLLPVDVTDMLTYLGLALSAIGAWLVYPAAGFLLAGGALFYLGVFHGRGGD